MWQNLGALQTSLAEAFKNSLQFVKLVVGQPIQKTVTIINTICNKSMDKHGLVWFGMVFNIQGFYFISLMCIR